LAALFTQNFATKIDKVYYGRPLRSKREDFEEFLSGIEEWPQLASKLQGFPLGPILQTLQNHVERARECGYFPSMCYTTFEKPVSGTDAIFNKQADEVQVVSAGEVRSAKHAGSTCPTMGTACRLTMTLRAYSTSRS